MGFFLSRLRDSICGFFREALHDEFPEQPAPRVSEREAIFQALTDFWDHNPDHCELEWYDPHRHQ